VWLPITAVYAAAFTGCGFQVKVCVCVRPMAKASVRDDALCHVPYPAVCRYCLRPVSADEPGPLFQPLAAADDVVGPVSP